MTSITKLSYGVAFTAILSVVALYISSIAFVQSLGISALVISILLGAILINTIHNAIPKSFSSGIEFSSKKILRLAIVLYGFRITFQEIQDVGTNALLIDVFIIISTFLLAIFVGIRLLKLDRDTAILIGAGSSICGAAAVLATESSIKSEPHKSVVAVSTVVIFGTLSMLLYPLLFKYLNMSNTAYGIYAGATIHEVAQVVVAGFAISIISAKYAVIVKMARVIMLAPFLVILGLFLIGKNSKMTIPWFAFGFIGIVIFNSFNLFPHFIVDAINIFDTFLLAMAMSAIGLETKYEKFKQAGIKPFLLALILFVWLLCAGYVITIVAC